MILNPFRGKNILITGGSKGIGLCMARQFASLGANIAIIARDKEALELAKREIEQSGSGIRCLAYACDVTDADTLSDYINMVRYEFGSIDGIVANSGYCHPGNFHEIELADIDRQIDVNLKGVAYTLRLGIPHLLESDGGFIAITSSPAGNAGIFGFSIYGATKSALNIMSHILRAEYASKGIRVHLLLPPDTNTPGYAEEISLYPKATKAILDGGVLLQPEPVAKTFVRGIANNKKVISAGFSTRLLLFIMRFMPSIWDLYVRGKVRSANFESESDEAIAEQETETETEIDETPENDSETHEEPEAPAPEAESTPAESDDESDLDTPQEEDIPASDTEDREDDTEQEETEDELHQYDADDLSDTTVRLDIEDLKPFLDRITKYSMGLELQITSILMGVAEMTTGDDRSWDIEAYHEQCPVPFRIEISVKSDDAIDMRFHTTTKLSLIIDQEFGRMFK